MVDFVVGGVQKAATSWLFRCMKSDPRLCIPMDKNDENGYIGSDEYFEKGLSNYKRSFNHCTDRALNGTASVNYIYDRAAHDEIGSMFADIKVIIILRNPIERAVSAAWWYVRRRVSSLKKVDSVIDKALSDWDRSEGCFLDDRYGLSDVIARGMYMDQLISLHESLKKGNIVLLFYSDIVSDAENAYQFIIDSLRVHGRELNRSIPFQSHPKVNTRSPFLARIERVLGSGRVGGKVFDLANRLLAGLHTRNSHEIDSERRTRLRRVYYDMASSLGPFIDNNEVLNSGQPAKKIDKWFRK